MNLDDHIQEVEEFEYEGAEKLSPIEYARYKGMRPQMVYYYIRNKVLTTEVCACGRRVLDVEHSDEALRARLEKKTGRKALS